MALQVFCDIGELVTLKSAALKGARHIQMEDLSVIKKAAMVVDQGVIVWLGEQKKIPSKYKKNKRISFNQAVVIPGFVECHTHTIFAGSRADEFELRNQGLSYQQIAEKGGGIISTVNATRKASEIELLKLAQKRVDQFVQRGVTTLEIKSGYGLTLQDEVKMLKVAKKLKGPEIVSTYLGPHAIPHGKTNEEYLQEILKQHLPKISKAKLAERVDMFIEKGYFTLDQGRKYFTEAERLGFRLTVHADQLNLTGASGLAVELFAQSADHVIQLDEPSIHRLAKSECTAVLLPAADLYLKMSYPPARKLIDQGARVALATDFNPGTSPTQDLMLVGLLARLKMKMTFAEVLAAYTIGAAFALGREDQCGSLEVGKRANFVVLEQGLNELFYHIGSNPVAQTWREGKRLHHKKSKKS